MNRRIVINVDRVRAASGTSPLSLPENLAREIADRRFGPGPDPIVTQIAAHIVDAIERVKESS
jgi:hypothetical protein